MQRPNTVDGLFHKGNPLTGEKGTPITEEWLNALIGVGAFLNGATEPPAAGLGGPGDYYYCTGGSSNLYGPKAGDNTWPVTPTQLRGPTSPVKGYDTLALANADLANIGTGIAIWVNADPTVTNNGYWLKSGGVLVQSSFDRVALLEAKYSVANEKVAPQAITPEKTTFFTVTSKNLLDKLASDVVLGGYYNEDNVYVVNAGYNQSGFIPVTAGLNYVTQQHTTFVVWYDAKGVRIGSTTSASFNAVGYVTAPAGAYFGRFLATTAAWATLQVEVGTVSTAVVEYAHNITPALIEGLTKSKITDLTIDFDKLNFLTIGKNLLNKTDPDVVLGGYYNQTGAYTASATLNQSGFIRVTPGQNYTGTYKSAFVLWYSINKVYMTDTTSTLFAANGYVTAPAGAMYARFISTVAAWATSQVELGTASTAYVPYVSPKIGPEYLAGSGASVLTGKKFTSYGDSIAAQGAWQPYVVSDLGVIHTNLGIGSTTLAYVAVWEATLPCFVNAARIQAIKDSNPDVITIMGGANDLARAVPIGTDAEFSAAIGSKDLATFKGAYSFLIETLLAWKPTLEIILMTMYGSGYNTYPTYNAAALAAASFYALPCIDLAKESGISPFNIAIYTTDNIHPNDAGGKRIANMVIEKMRALSRV